jgi:hypothetical protein
MEQIEKRIYDVKRKYSLKSIVLVHEYESIVTCKAFRYHGEHFCFVGGDSLSAIEGVVKLMEKYEKFKTNLITGTLKPDEPYDGVNHKYYSKPYTDLKEGYLITGSDKVTLHWKYDDGHLFVTDIAFRRGGFFVSNPPYPLDELSGHTKHKIPNKSFLKEGEELWFWDDMQCLSGQAGEAIVKDGMVIAIMATMMS